MRDDLLDGRPGLSKDQMPFDRKEIEIVRIRDLVPNPLNEFKVREDSEDFQDLLESVREIGFIEPIIVKAIEHDKYMLISGHRRKRVAELLGIRDIDCYVVEPVDEYEEVRFINDCNFKKRNDILPSERAKALKREMDAQNKHGQRTDLMYNAVDGTLCNALHKVDTASEIASAHDMQRRNVFNYIHLNELSDDLLDKVDDKTISFRCASEYLYKLNSDNQEAVNKLLDDGNKLKQADFISVLREQQKMEQSGKVRKLKLEEVLDIIEEDRNKPVTKGTIYKLKQENYIGKFSFIFDDLPQSEFERLVTEGFKLLQEKANRGEII